MKKLEITDYLGKGFVIACEKHFKEYLPQMSKASEIGVEIIIWESKEKDCTVCNNIKVGSSPWAGEMSKVWGSIQRQAGKSEIG